MSTNHRCRLAPSAHPRAVNPTIPVVFMRSVISIAAPVFFSTAHAAAAEQHTVTVYSARLQDDPDQSVAAMASLASRQGSIECVTYSTTPFDAFATQSNARRPSTRTPLSPGDPDVGYPGFTAGPVKRLFDAGILPPTAPSPRNGRIHIDNNDSVLDWSAPSTPIGAWTIRCLAAGRLIAVCHLSLDHADRPAMVRTQWPDGRGSIVQVFDYDAVPNIRLPNPAPWTAQQSWSDARNLIDAHRRVTHSQPALPRAPTSDGVLFAAGLTGLSFDLDTEWQPGGGVEPGAFPAQVRIIAGAGADMRSNVTGDFLLDSATATLRPNAASGWLEMNFGVEFTAQAAISLFGDPIVFDIPGIPNFDLRVQDRQTFQSYLLDSMVHLADNTDRVDFAFDVSELVLPDPNLLVEVVLGISVLGRAQMTADAIAVNDGSRFVQERQPLTVNAPCGDYHQVADYQEALTMTATTTFYPSIYVEYLLFSWEFELPEIPWTISGPINLNFSLSPLDFNGQTAPTITRQPANQTVCEGRPVALEITAEGTPPIRYIWRKDGVGIPGVTASTLVFPSATVLDAGLYDAVIFNGCGALTSDAASLVVWPAGTTDVNGDGRRDGLDIRTLIALLTRPDGQSAGLESCAADANDDGRVDLADLPAIIASLIQQ